MLNKNDGVTFKYNNPISVGILKYLFIIFTILFNSVYFYSVNLHYMKYVIDVGWQVVLLILCVLSISKHTQMYLKNVLLFISIYVTIILLILFCYYIYYPYSLNYLLEFAIDPILLILYFYSESTNNKFNLSFFYLFERIMVFLAILSLICYLIYMIGIKPTSSLVVHWGNFPSDPSYFYINFFPVNNYNVVGLNVIRNSGIFIEPPTYSYFLFVALLINLFILKYKRLFNLSFIVLIIAIFSTFSTTGMILSIASIIVYELFHNSNIIIKLIFIILIPILGLLMKLLFDVKKNTSATDLYGVINSSYYVRHDDMLAFLRDWHDHIIFGNGLGNSASVYKYINPLRLIGENNDIGLTTSFFELLAYGGIILILLYVIPTLLSFWISPNVCCFVIFNFIVFMVEGIMLYKIYIIILSCCVSMFLWKKFIESKA